jgi:hypothetical protein
MAANVQKTPDSLEIFSELKSMIISNAKLQHGCSKNGRVRNYDIATSTHPKTRGQYRVSLVAYDENYKAPGKMDIDSKVLTRSAVKQSLNLAMEDLLKRGQEELWT